MPMPVRRLILAVATLAGALLSTVGGDGTAEAPSRPTVLLAAIEGAIGPATVRHVEKVVERARERNAALLVLRLDTPGGLASSMREVITVILESQVPVAGWVAPPGAHAASAGTYILYATHLAAMAPGTNIGAATPVQLGGGLPGLPPGDDGKDGGKDGAPSRSSGSAMAAKATNDAVALIRSLAEMHGRNAEWAEKAVREAASLSAGAAQAQGVVELLAADLDELLAKADGRTVTVGRDARILATRDAAVERVEVDAVTRLLGILSNPNVALILLMVGVYGLIFEFATPGAIAPGVVGVICLTLGLYALQQLPLDYAGLALVLFGIALMTAEVITPSFGVLGIGGLASLVFGSAMLIDSDSPEFQLSWWTIGGVAAVGTGTLALLIGYLWRAYRRPGGPVGAIAGAMVGLDARVEDWSGDAGHVWARGERWRAQMTSSGATGSGAAGSLAAGDTVRVCAIDGLTLRVERDASSGKSLEGD